jgi:hypothetical protein
MLRERERTIGTMGIGFILVVALICAAIAAGIWLVPMLVGMGPVG